MCAGKDIAMFGSALQGGSVLSAAGANRGGYAFNKRVLKAQAKQEGVAGNAEAARIREQGADIEAKQRVGAAAGNVAVGSGTALKLQQQTAMLAGADADEARRSAMLRQWGYRAEAAQQRYEARIKSNKAYMDVAGTFLSGSNDPQNSLSGLFG